MIIIANSVHVDIYPSKPMITSEMIQRVAGNGFIAALDQSGGSTPKALGAYGIEADAWGDDQEQMFELMHQMRTRIIVNPSFDQRVCGAILFERTMNSEVEGMPTAKYLWEQKNIVPFLKVDEGLQDEADGVQLMKPLSGLGPRLDAANANGVFGTKMRSVVHSANKAGIAAIAEQQFSVGNDILAQNLMPILEPEVSIKSDTKAEAEEMLKAQLLSGLDALVDDQQVMLKLTLPEEAGFYSDVINHPRVLRVVALSGGYSRDDANQKLSQNSGMIASFSRALVQDLRAGQSDEEFTAALDSAVESIYQASVA